MFHDTAGGQEELRVTFSSSQLAILLLRKGNTLPWKITTEVQTEVTNVYGV